VPKEEAVDIEVGGRTIHVTNPSKVYFPDPGITKLDLVRYYIEVGPAALVGCRDRPSILFRWPDGVQGDPFFQKRIPKGAPEWVQSVTITYPSGRTARTAVMEDVAHLAWAATLGCLDINPWPVRRADVDRPDELRIDLDPTPEVTFDVVRQVALIAQEALAEHGLTGFPKTSGKRGIHIPVRIEPRWEFTVVRRAALALARDIERRAPKLATSAWWKEQRHGVFVDYNQNARDRTTASAYSVRPVPDARVSMPVQWEDIVDVEPADFTLLTVPAVLRERGDAGAGIDASVGDLTGLLELADRDEAGGLGDAPWPPHFPKAKGEPDRVAPSRAKKKPSGSGT
jgi:bifunctional non-homologous end joining protein LigD